MCRAQAEQQRSSSLRLLAACIACGLARLDFAMRGPTPEPDWAEALVGPVCCDFSGGCSTHPSVSRGLNLLEH